MRTGAIYLRSRWRIPRGPPGCYRPDSRTHRSHRYPLIACTLDYREHLETHGRDLRRPTGGASLHFRVTLEHERRTHELPGAQILVRGPQPIRFAKGNRRIPWPIRRPQRFPPDQHQIRLAISHNLLGLHWLGDQPHGRRRDVSLSPDCFGKPDLISRCVRDLLMLVVPTRAAIDQIDTGIFHQLRQRDRIVDCPSTIDPL